MMQSWSLDSGTEDVLRVELEMWPRVAVVRVVGDGGRSMTIAQASAVNQTEWRVRALVAVHEEVIPASQLVADLLADVRELFSGVLLPSPADEPSDVAA